MPAWLGRSAAVPAAAPVVLRVEPRAVPRKAGSC
jgi:hypothetical protein